MQLHFTPFKSIGEFILGNTIDMYLIKYKFIYSSDVNNIGIEVYELPEFGLSMNIIIKSKIIYFIICSVELIYLDKNIIGMDIQKFIKFSNEKYFGEVDKVDFEEDNIPQYVYEFENIGLQIWTKKGKIVTAIASVREFIE
jgi:hypothetical protein